MVFHTMPLCLNTFGIDIACLREIPLNPGKTREYFRAVDSEAWHAQGIEKLGSHSRPWIARDSDMLDIPYGQACLLKAVTHGIFGKARRVFDSIKTLFFDGSYQLPVAHDRCRRISVVGVDSEDVHYAIGCVWASAKTVKLLSK